MPSNSTRLPGAAEARLLGPRLRNLAVALSLLLSLVPPAETVQAAPAPEESQPGELRAFQRVSPNTGWVLLGSSLYWTDDAGQSWRDISPAGLEAEARAAAFADGQHGWLVAARPAPSGGAQLVLARTGDGGASWQRRNLDLFAPGDVDALAAGIYLDLLDAGTGWLVIKRASGSSFSLGTLFKTSDAGATWQRLSIPAAGPVRLENEQHGWIDAAGAEGRHVTRDGGQTWAPEPAASMPGLPSSSDNPLGIAEVSMATDASGWARSVTGECAGGVCVLTVRLLATDDAGLTWQPVALPQPLEAQSFAAPEPQSATPIGGLKLTYDGQGFDSCTQPTAAGMETWYASSPYRVWNLYLGGSAKASLCPTLTTTYLSDLTKQGWKFIPTWVGPQAACSGFASRMSYDPATAYAQGVAEANLAVDRAAALKLTFPDKTGTILYYDLEAYSASTNDACETAAQSFISGWVAQLHATGNQAGVYGSPCGSFMADFAAIANVPDVVWLAHWIWPYQYRETVSVFNLACIDNSLWTNAQRLRQYAGGHNETWGGVTINIDSNVISGTVTAMVDACAPAADEVALFELPNFAGQCVVLGSGSYPTASAAGMPDNSISSVRVGSEVTTLRLCRDESYLGLCDDFFEDAADLSTSIVGDNQVSAVIVEVIVAPAPYGFFLPFVTSLVTDTVAGPGG